MPSNYQDRTSNESLRFYTKSFVILLLLAVSLQVLQDAPAVRAQSSSSCPSVNASGSIFNTEQTGIIVVAAASSSSQTGPSSLCHWTVQCPPHTTSQTTKIVYRMGGVLDSDSTVVVQSANDTEGVNRTFFGNLLSGGSGVEVLTNGNEMDVFFYSTSGSSTSDWTMNWTCTDLSSEQPRCLLFSQQSISADHGTVSSFSGYSDDDSSSLLSSSSLSSSGSSSSYALGQACELEIICADSSSKYISFHWIANINEIYHSLKIRSLSSSTTTTLLDLALGSKSSSSSSTVATASQGIVAGNSFLLDFNSLDTASRFSGRGWQLHYQCQASQCSATSPRSGTTVRNIILDGPAVELKTDLDGSGTTVQPNLHETCVWDIECPAGTKYALVDYYTSLSNDAMLKVSMPLDNYRSLLEINDSRSGSQMIPVAATSTSLLHFMFQSQADASAGATVKTRCLSTSCSSPNRTDMTYESTSATLTGKIVSDSDGAGHSDVTPGLEACSWDIYCPVGHSFSVRRFVPGFNSSEASALIRSLDGSISDVALAPSLNSSSQILTPISRALLRDQANATIIFNSTATNFGFELEWFCNPTTCAGSVRSVGSERGYIDFGYDGMHTPGSKCEFNISCPPIAALPSSSINLRYYNPSLRGQLSSLPRLQSSQDTAQFEYQSQLGSGYVATFSHTNEQLFYSCEPWQRENRFPDSIAPNNNISRERSSGYFQLGYFTCWSPNASSYDSSVVTSVVVGGNETAIILSDPDGEGAGYHPPTFCRFLAQCQVPGQVMIFDPDAGQSEDYYYFSSTSIRQESINLYDETGAPSEFLVRRYRRQYSFPNTFDQPLEFAAVQRNGDSRGFTVGLKCLPMAEDITCSTKNNSVFDLTGPSSVTVRLKSDQDGVGTASIPISGEPCSYRVICPSSQAVAVTVESNQACGSLSFYDWSSGNASGPTINGLWKQFLDNDAKNMTLSSPDVRIVWSTSRRLSSASVNCFGWDLTARCSPPLKQPSFEDRRCTVVSRSGWDVNQALQNDEVSLGATSRAFELQKKSLYTGALQTYDYSSPGCTLSFGCKGVLDAHTLVLVRPASSRDSTDFGQAVVWSSRPQLTPRANWTLGTGNWHSWSRLGTSDRVIFIDLSQDKENTVLLRHSSTLRRWPPTAFFCLTEKGDRPAPSSKRNIRLYTGGSSLVSDSMLPSHYTSVFQGQYRSHIDDWAFLSCYNENERVAIVSISGNVIPANVGKDHLSIQNGETGAVTRVSSGRFQKHTAVGLAAKSLLVHFKSTSVGNWSDHQSGFGYRVEWTCGYYLVNGIVVDGSSGSASVRLSSWPYLASGFSILLLLLLL